MKSPQREDAEKFKAIIREWERREERREEEGGATLRPFGRLWCYLIS